VKTKDVLLVGLVLLLALVVIVLLGGVRVVKHGNSYRVEVSAISDLSDGGP
jgi:hypothetical protein